MMAHEADEKMAVELVVDAAAAPPMAGPGTTPCGGDDTGEHALPPGFEGPEKCLEIDFTPTLGPARGLRDITRDQWDEILLDAKCTILCSASNDYLDSYVLSESSLFVYPHTMVLKTCGTTTLLRALPRLIKYSKALGMEVEWMVYTRKDFMFPSAQLFPHTNPNEEIEYLKKWFDGSAFVLGPITGDHWFVFIGDFCERPSTESNDRTLDMMMFDIDPEVAKLFSDVAGKYKDHKEATVAAGIDRILPGADVQEFVFEPCGYSCNGQLHSAYFTIHITPEEHCSYASFETNIKQAAYTPLVKHVLAIFKPKRFTMTMFADQFGYKEIEDAPFHSSLPVPAAAGVYERTASSQAAFGDYLSFLSNFKLTPTLPSAPRVRHRGESV